MLKNVKGLRKIKIRIENTTDVTRIYNIEREKIK